MNAWRRGTSRGLGYSLAVTALGTWMGPATVMGMRLPVPPLTVLAGALQPADPARGEQPQE